MEFQSIQKSELIEQEVTQSPVSVYTEWDPLEEVIVGIIDDFRIPEWDTNLKAVIPQRTQQFFIDNSGKRFDKEHVTRARKEVDGLASLLEGLGITVKRPNEHDHFRPIVTPFFSTNGGYYSAMPRDGMFALGNKIIETPMAWRSRYFETFPFRDILNDYFKRGAHITSAPKPMLRDTMWKQGHSFTEEYFDQVIEEHEPLFDAADFLRIGADIVGQRSHVTNMLGVQWLQRELGENYKIHIYEFDDASPMHIDTTIMPLSPGRVLVNKAWVSKLPEFFKDWEILVPPPSTIPDSHPLYMTSKWIHTNVLSLDDRTVIVERQEADFIAAFRRWGYEVIPCDFRNFQSFGGSFHCATLDVRRSGKYQRYT
jgi:glycine amidinotransferase